MNDDARTILCYGDSNTWGYDPATGIRFPRSVRWPGVLQAELGEGYHVIEEGLCGRTTVWEDPIEGYKSGAAQIVPILLSHVPLELVIILLGSNDLKCRFSVSALDVAQGAGSLVRRVRQCEAGFSGPPPEVLLLCPPPFASLENAPFAPIFVGGEEKSKQLGFYFRQVAEELGCRLMDTAPVVYSSPIDGIHWEAGEHARLGRALAAEVRAILGDIS